MTEQLFDAASEEVGPPERYAAGAGCYIADLLTQDCATMVIIRSDLAHARLGFVDLEEVRRAPGVLGAWSAMDIAADVGAVPTIASRIAMPPAASAYLQGVLAVERVRYVGEPIAVVVASDRYVAEDAAALVELDLSPLPAVVDAATAVSGPALFPEGNEIAVLEVGFGDADVVFSQAALVESAHLTVGRHSGVPMETRGLVAEPGSNGSMTVYGTTKVVHSNRETLAELLRVHPSFIRMREVDVGGGFGVRGEFYPEDFLVPWAARVLGKRVAWIEDRREHLVAANHSRDQVHRVSLAASADGELLGIRTECFVDSGAYVRSVGLRVAELTLAEMPGPYRFAACIGVAHCVVTNRTPTGTYRSPGRFESSFVRERMVDRVAGRLGLSCDEIRRRNLVRVRDMPYRRGGGSSGKEIVLSEGDYPHLFDRVAARTEDAAARDRHELQGQPGLSVGHATACFVEKSGLGPFEDASIEALADGSIEVRTGASFLGQGLQIALARVVGEALGVPTETVKVMRIDTDRIGTGMGTYASRSMVMAGGAVALACESLIEEGKRATADELEISPHDLEFGAGTFSVRGMPSVRLTLAEVAERCTRGTTGLGLCSVGHYEKETVTYGFGAHGAVVVCDLRTGIVKVERLILGYDIGRAIDGDVVVGQLEGAAVQALGGALLERFSYDDLGNPLCTTFMDYLMPTAGDAPTIEVLLEYSAADDNPLGVRGAGEAGVPAVAAAIARAIEVSVGAGAVLTETPITPSTVFGLLSADDRRQ